MARTLEVFSKAAFDENSTNITIKCCTRGTVKHRKGFITSA